MGIGVRDILLLIRARDEASRVLDRLNKSLNTTAQKGDSLKAVGAGMASIGTSLIVAGATGVAAMRDVISSYQEYQQEAAMAYTQTRGFGQSIDDLKRIAESTALAIPANFKDMQSTIYDIYSTFDFSNVFKDGPKAVTDMAEVILQTMAKTSVAAGVDMAIVNEAVLSTMNAYGLGAEKATYTTDILMQMVAKGKGSFNQFGDQVSKVIPTAVTAGQSLEEVGAALAFLTSRGMSVPIAATAVRRAMGAITDPKAIDRLKEMGINVLDATGSFRPFTQVVAELRDKLAGMSEEQRSFTLDKIFQGAGGTEAAMQYLKFAVNDTNHDLEQFQQFMFDAKGATDFAYEAMRDTPQAQMQAFANAIGVFKINLGDAVWKALTPFVNKLSELLSWFNRLSPETQTLIAKILVFGTILAVVVGTLLIVGGAIMMIVGGFMAMGAGAGLIMGIFGGVSIAIVAIIAVVTLLIMNWEKVKTVAIAVWEAIKAKLTEAGNAIMGVVVAIGERLAPFGEMFRRLGAFIAQSFTGIMPAFSSLGEALKTLANSAGVQFLLRFFGMLAQVIGITIAAILGFVGIIIGFLAGGVLTGALTGIAKFIGNFVEGLVTMLSGVVSIVTGIITVITGIFSGDLAMIGEGFKQIFMGIINTVWGLIVGVLGSILAFVAGFVAGFINWFVTLYDVLVGHSIVPDMVNGILQWIGQLPARALQFIADLVNGAITWFTNLLTSSSNSTLNMVGSVVAAIATMPARVLAFILTMVSQGLSQFGKWAADSAASALKLVTGVVTFFAGLPAKALSAISSLGGMLVSEGNRWLSGLGNSVNSGINSVVTFFSALGGRVISALSGFSLYSVGTQIVQGLINGISSMGGFVGSAISNMVNSGINAAKRALGIASPSKVFISLGKFSGEGLAIGLDAMNSLVGTAGKNLALAAIPNVDSIRLNSVTPNGYYSPTSRYSNDLETGGKTINNNIDMTINTEEIDPIKQAADLGYEIARTGGRF